MFSKKKRQPQVLNESKKIDIKSENRGYDIARPNKKDKKNKTKLAFIFLGILILGAIVFFAVKTYLALDKITVDNLRDGSLFLSNKSANASQLANNGAGRINILLIGIGGAGHPGGTLADTIIVASIDPKNKTMAMLSIPRDLYVKYPKQAKSQSGKINSVYAYGEDKSHNIAGGGGQLLSDEVSTILNIPINYYIRVDFGGFEKIIDQLGGITVDVPKAIYDPYFPADNTINYSPFSISAGTHHMDGKTALRYARSRETTSDFDRSNRQEIVLAAIKDKALTLGVLSNPKKMIDILDLVSNHVETSLQTNEIEKLMGILKGIDSNSIQNGVLDNSPTGPLVSANNGAYVLLPKTGDYSQIQKIAHALFANPYLNGEKAEIAILNGSGQSGQATQLSDKLVSNSYIVGTVANAPTTVSKTVIYDLSNGQKNKTTLSLLKKELSASVSTNPSQSVINSAPGADIIVVLGQDYNDN